MNAEILNTNFDIENVKYPKNIYAVRIRDEMNVVYDISVQHNGYCPPCSTERDRSRLNDYLSNLSYNVVTEFFRTINKKMPKKYYEEIEIMTDSNGDLYHLSKAVS